MKNLFSTLLLILAIGVLPASAQKKVLYGVGFYNVENLFDTQHDSGKNDHEFLPTGSYQWTEQKYTAKLRNIAQVLSELCTEFGNKKNPAGAAVIGLSEVENSRALEDLLREPALAARGYRYVHFDGPDRRGIDVAFLYNPKAWSKPNSFPTSTPPKANPTWISVSTSTRTVASKAIPIKMVSCVATPPTSRVASLRSKAILVMRSSISSSTTGLLAARKALSVSVPVTKCAD